MWLTIKSPAQHKMGRWVNSLTAFFKVTKSEEGTASERREIVL